jgi:hypothetical protein
MGKRELLLIVAFAIVGAIVYQVTAPPPAPGERSFSPGRILDNIRREVRGNRAAAESLNTSTHPVEPTVTELRLAVPKGLATELTVIGEDRQDINAEIQVHSNASDDQEAERTAKATVLKVERAGTRLIASLDFPLEGRQSAALTLHIPSRLRLQIESTRNRTRISNVAAVDTQNGRGTTEISQIKDLVVGNYRGGELRVVRAGSVKLTTVGMDVRLEQISAQTSVNMRSGDLRGSELGGPVDIDANGVDVELEKLEKTTGIVRITASGGSVSVKGLRTEARIDARNSEVEAAIERPVPVAIYSEGGSPVEITPPPGGYQLDAVATDGSIELPEGSVEVTTNGTERRATGPVKGGGPTITIRVAHASITVRDRE